MSNAGKQNTPMGICLRIILAEHILGTKIIRPPFWRLNLFNWQATFDERLCDFEMGTPFTHSPRDLSVTVCFL